MENKIFLHNQKIMLSLGKKNNFRIKLGKEAELLSNGSYKCSPSKKAQETVDKLSQVLENFGNMFLSKMEALKTNIFEIKVDSRTQHTNEDSEKTIKELSPKKGETKNNALSMEERFQCIEIEIPKIKAETRHEQIQQWLGTTCKKIFSISFKLLLDGNLNIESTKVYCSENLLQCLIKFIKQNNLSKEEVERINVILKNELLPYFCLKYPQSEIAKANLRLSKQVIKIDNYNNNANELVHLSQIKFQLDYKGEYNKQIMNVLNYIINLPAKMTTFQAKKQIKKINTEGEVEGISYEYQREEGTIFAAFEYEMEQLFKSLEVEHEMLRMKGGEAPDPNKTPPYNAAKLQLYKQKVKQYTKYLIGRKIPENVMEYTEQEISQEKLTIKNSQILRILNKLCESLEQKFYEMDKHIINREEQFRMRDSSEAYMKKTHRILFSKLLQREKRNIEEYLSRIMQNNYNFQHSQANVTLPRQLRCFTEEEGLIGLFSATISSNNENYIVGYLNRLIHGILVATAQFQSMMKIETMNSPKAEKFRKGVEDLCQNKITLEKLEEIQKKVSLKKLKNKNVSDLVPQIVTFRLGDILRCKCSSKQSQITALYKEILRISKASPEIFKVIRIKNRLEKGNRDILINLLYRNLIVVETQLKVDDTKQNFITCSNNFNHYLYEIQRAEFGPISELCSIWINKDHRAKFYEEKFNKTNKRKKIQNFVHDCPGILKEQYLPIICSFCSAIFNKANCIEKNYICNVCDKSICGFCQLEMNDSLIITSLRTSLKGIIPDQQKLTFVKDRVPQSGACIDINKKDIFVKKFFKVQYNNSTYLFEETKNTYNLIKQLKDESEVEQFLATHAVVETPRFIKKPLMEIALDYFAPKHFQMIYKEERNVVLSEKMQISDKQLVNITPCPSVNKINISENNISQIQLIVNKFPSLKIAVLSQNKLAQISAEIKNLSALQFLDLSWNQIKIVPQQIKQLKSLTFLNISHNLLEKLPEDFSNLSNLKNISLSNNNLKSLPILPDSLRKIYAQHNQMAGSFDIGKFKNIKAINLSFNQLTAIEGAVNMPELRLLDISYNKLKELDFTDLVQLQNLNASFCQITSMSFKLSDQNENDLKILNLGSNKITNLPSQFFEEIFKVENLNLSSNNIERIPKEIFLLTNLEDLNIMGIRQRLQKDNKLSRPKKQKLKAEEKPRRRKKSKFYEESEMKTNVNYINHLEIEAGEFSRNATESEMTESEDSGSEEGEDFILPKEMQKMLQLNSLNISRNGLTKIPKILSKMPHLEELDISDNKISEITQFLGVFNLDISSNKLRQFTTETASFLKTVKQLNLRGNRLKGMETEDIKKLFSNYIEVEYKQSKESQKSIKTTSSKGQKRRKSPKKKESKENKENIIHFNHINYEKEEKKRDSFNQLNESERIEEVVEQNQY